MLSANTLTILGEDFAKRMIHQYSMMQLLESLKGAGADDRVRIAAQTM